MQPTSFLLCLASMAVPSAAVAKAAVPLQPISFPFAPESPRALPPDHPLYQRITVEPVAGMPDKIGGFLTPITNARELNQALRDTLARANMLAPAGTEAKARLIVRWTGLQTPREISFSSEATATLNYSLVRISNGELLFSRDIRTHTRSTGGDAVDRLKGNARLALMSNLGSAMLCLDKAALGQAPRTAHWRP